MALNHSVKGSTNYAIVGTPTITDGVVSGFSNDNFLRINSMPLSSSDWEIVCKGNYTASQQTTQRLFSRGAQVFYLQMRESSGEWEFILPNVQTVNLGSVTTYPFIKLVKANNSISAYHSSDGISYSLVQDNISTTSLADGIFVLGGGTSAYWNGSIDLNHTYIKVNGAAWFGVCPVEVKHIDYGTSTGYTVVGSPTINNGVVSGFSEDDYLTLPAVTLGTNFEMKLRVTTPSDFSAAANNNIVGFGSYDYYWISVLSTGRIAYRYSSWQQAVVFVQTGTLDISTDYDLILSQQQAGTITLKYKKSTESTYTTVTGSYDRDYLQSSRVISLGRFLGQYARPFSGSIDLNFTYIKVNGKLWFFRPVTNYLVKDNKLVWCDQDLYLNDSGTITLASQDTAPVPSGFTYGSTTTTDVGLVDIPSQVFTAKPGATIGKGEVPEPTPDTPSTEIDANTKAVYHFENDYINAIDNTASSYTALANGYSTQYKKFGTYSLELKNTTYMEPLEGIYIGGGTANQSTVDFWVYIVSGYSDVFKLRFGGTGAPAAEYSSGNLVLTADNNSSVGTVQFATGSWHHIAFEHKWMGENTTSVGRYYIDGIPTQSFDASNADASSVITWCKVGQTGNVYIDELRVSDVLRYNGNSFTPPTQPYS